MVAVVTLCTTRCRHDLTNLKMVWERVRLIDAQQSEWKRHRWQKMNVKFLREETNKQLETVRNLPEDVFTWDVYMGLHESITNIQVKYRLCYSSLTVSNNKLLRDQKKNIWRL